MKTKIFSVALVATAMLSFSSCNSAPKAKLETEADSLAYYYGVNTTRGLREYLVHMGVDSAQTDAFLKGFLKATGNLSDSEKAYNVGMQVGQQVKDQFIPHFVTEVQGGDSTITFNEKNYIAGFVAGFNASDDSVYEDAGKTIEEINEQRTARKYAEWKLENEQWLIDNGTKDGIVTLASGLQYEVLKEGKGAVPTADSRVKVHYHGTTIDGNVFDSSVERKQPAEFGVKQVIAGWTEALQLMPVGSKWRLYIPQQLAYGSREQRAIKPYSTLIFEVELLEIVK
jgi:FKBP-type peptidyl-prolyl cis-trans isomerase